MEEIAKKLAGLLLEGDQQGAWELIKVESLLGKDSLHIYERVLTPAMRHIGFLWESNEITVADEHLATSTCDFILARYLWHKQKESPTAVIPKKVMFLCVEKEQHYLGLKMASQLFSEAGWRTRFHGPNLPLDYVRKAAEEWQPDVICISFSIIYHAEYLVTYISELEALPLRPTVIVGGRLVGKYNFDRYRSERTILTDNLKDVQKWLSSQSNGVKSSV